MPIYSFGDYQLDTSLYQLRQANEVVELGPRVYDVLLYLLHHRDRLISKDELIREVWGATAMSGSSVPTCIAAVRKAIRDDPADPRYIETLRGRGYRFIAEVREVTDEASSSSHAAPHRPALADRSGAPPLFVGRDAELASLYAAFERSLTGTPQLVLVSGEAGIGKTRILEELALSVRDDGATVLVGRCVEGGGAPAFWPWVQLIRAFLESTDASAIAARLGSLAPSLFHMIPELCDLLPDVPPPPPDDSEQARFRLFDAVTALLRKAATDRPVLLLLDDLHRADTASLSLLQFVIHELRDAQILCVGTYRDGDPQLDAKHTALLAALTREEPTRCIELRGLDYDSVERFVAHASGSGHANAELVAALHEQTGGNPFFLTQIVHLLAADGRLGQERSRLGVSLVTLPKGVRESITRQMLGLPPATRAFLEAAAVIGREFTTELASSVAQSESLLPLQPALNARLVSRSAANSNTLFFTHMILRDCIYDSLPPDTRAHLHLRVAEAMDRITPTSPNANSSNIAHHYLNAASVAGFDRAIIHSIDAGDWASARLAYEDAANLYRQALNLTRPAAPSHSLAALLLKLGEAELRAGERSHSRDSLIEAATLARQIAAPDLIAHAALALAPGFFAIEVGAYDHELVALLQEALASLPDVDSPLRAQLLARLAIALVWSDCDDMRHRFSIEAIEMARRLNDPVSIAAALTARHETLWGPGEFDKRSRVTKEIAEIATIASNTETQLLSHLLRATADLEAGKLLSAEREFGRFAQIANGTRHPQYQWYVDLSAGMRCLMRGEFASAEYFARRFQRLGAKAKDINAIQSYGTHLSILRWEQNRIAEILPVVEDFIRLHPGVSAWKCVRMFLHFDSGDLDRARRDLRLLARDDFSSISNNTNRIVALCLLAEVSSGLNDLEKAKALYDILLPDRTLNAVIGFSTAFFGSVEERLGLLALSLGLHDRAREHLWLAEESHEDLNAIPWLARTRFYRARMMLMCGTPADRNAATRLLGSSRDVASAIGMKNLLKKIEAIPILR